ncbi:MAG: hypothetical protein ACLPOO_19575 [Terriglobales bacterium]
MGHKQTPQYVDRDGAVEQQAAVNAEALRRARLRNDPTAPADLAGTGGVDIAAGIVRDDGLGLLGDPSTSKGLRKMEHDVPFRKEEGESAADATLAWGGGMTTATVGENDIPFSADMARVAGVGASGPSRDPGSAFPHGASTEEIFGSRK